MYTYSRLGHVNSNQYLWNVLPILKSNYILCYCHALSCLINFMIRMFHFINYLISYLVWFAWLCCKKWWLHIWLMWHLIVNWVLNSSITKACNYYLMIELMQKKFSTRMTDSKWFTLQYSLSNVLVTGYATFRRYKILNICGGKFNLYSQELCLDFFW